MKTLEQLLEKEVLTAEEFEILECEEEIDNLEDCGMSGRIIGAQLFTADYRGEEIEILVKFKKNN